MCLGGGACGSWPCTCLAPGKYLSRVLCDVCPLSVVAAGISRHWIFNIYGLLLFLLLIFVSFLEKPETWVLWFWQLLEICVNCAHASGHASNHTSGHASSHMSGIALYCLQSTLAPRSGGTCCSPVLLHGTSPVLLHGTSLVFLRGTSKGKWWLEWAFYHLKKKKFGFYVVFTLRSSSFSSFEWGDSVKTASRKPCWC